MKNLFIIILNPNVDTSIIKRRIEDLGEYYVVYNNQYLVLSKQDDAQNVYSEIVKNDDNIIGTIVLSISTKELSYWGYADKSLWEWLDKHTKNTDS